MSSSAEASAGETLRVLEQLRERLEQAGALALEMREALKRADAQAVEGATSRLETLALEFKVLRDEYRRLPDEQTKDPALAEARGKLERTATQLARSAAVGGGLLERMVTMSRGLAETFLAANGQTYLANGKTRETPFAGLQLREEA